MGKEKGRLRPPLSFFVHLSPGNYNILRNIHEGHSARPTRHSEGFSTIITVRVSRNCKRLTEPFAGPHSQSKSFAFLQNSLRNTHAIYTVTIHIK